MPLISPQNHNQYLRAVDGVAGNFSTPAGRVIFVQTRARLSADSGDTSRASRLTGLLTPAREAFEVRQMDFNQLLQRDLDDHRISHELVPYILNKQLNGPAFFPPILAALLPFENRQPRDELPSIVETLNAVDPEYGDSARWNMSTSGSVFRLQLLCGSDAQVDAAGQAVLRWNDEKAKLIIMDGQHRAMALLAIHRTLTNSWSAAGGQSERYKPFYESRIHQLWREANNGGTDLQLTKMEFPVTICIFPEYTGPGPGKNPHSAARKLFVDVNKEAKPPSEGRLILLSDVRLNYVLARELLNRLRDESWDKRFPVYAVEYDNPEPRTNQPRRWNAVTNLEILLRSVEFCCFGPSEIVSEIDQLTKPKQGRPDKRRMNAYFREQMRFQDIFGTSIPDGPRTLDRQELGLESFPIYNQAARVSLLNSFYEKWGNGLLRLLSEIEPYKQHIAAARSIAEGWGPCGDVTSGLAKEALFDGVGMFWTLERGDQHWREEVAKANELQATAPGQSDVSRAWKLVVETKRSEFERERSRLYLGGSDESRGTASHEFYEVALTYAAQVGLALTWAALRHQNARADSNAILDVLIAGVNRALTTGPVASRDRKLILSKGGADPFNQLPRMDASFAAYFRLFWLELLLVEQNHGELSAAGINLDSAMELLSKGRKFYLLVVAEKHAASHKIAHDDWSLGQCAREGRDTAIKSLAKVYHKWFGGPTDEWRERLSSLLAEPTAAETAVDSGDDPEAPIDTGGI